MLRLPIYGQLCNASKTSLKIAGRELCVTTLFSLLPLWLYPTIAYFAFGQPFWGTLADFASNGELFIYSAALVGPLIYAITKSYGGETKDERSVDGEKRSPFPKMLSIQFPYGIWFVLISIFVCCFASIFFGIMRAGSAGLLPILPNDDTLVFISCVAYAFTLSCAFCVSVYRINLETAAEVFGQDTRDLMQQWEQQSGR